MISAGIVDAALNPNTLESTALDCLRIPELEGLPHTAFLNINAVSAWLGL
jgi:hypothetical protein